MPKSTSSQSRSPKARANAGKSATGSARQHPFVQKIFAQTRRPEFQDYLAKLLLELCRINTTPNPDVAVMRKAEDGCFRVLERELAAMNFDGALR
jgi:hypothetical protein